MAYLMIATIKNLLHYMPVLFGFGFFGPLFAQLMVIAGYDQVFGLSVYWPAIALGGAWGIFAQVTGRWI